MALAWSMDIDRSTFSTAEQDKIIEMWRMVAEDFIPFDVDEFRAELEQLLSTREDKLKAVKAKGGPK